MKQFETIWAFRVYFEGYLDYVENFLFLQVITTEVSLKE